MSDLSEYNVNFKSYSKEFKLKNVILNLSCDVIDVGNGYDFVFYLMNDPDSEDSIYVVTSNVAPPSTDDAIPVKELDLLIEGDFKLALQGLKEKDKDECYKFVSMMRNGVLKVLKRVSKGIPFSILADAALEESFLMIETACEEKGWIVFSKPRFAGFKNRIRRFVHMNEKNYSEVAPGQRFIYAAFFVNKSKSGFQPLTKVSTAYGRPDDAVAYNELVNQRFEEAKARLDDIRQKKAERWEKIQKIPEFLEAHGKASLMNKIAERIDRSNQASSNLKQSILGWLVNFSNVIDNKGAFTSSKADEFRKLAKSITEHLESIVNVVPENEMLEIFSSLRDSVNAFCTGDSDDAVFVRAVDQITLEGEPSEKNKKLCSLMEKAGIGGSDVPDNYAYFIGTALKMTGSGYIDRSMISKMNNYPKLNTEYLSLKKDCNNLNVLRDGALDQETKEEKKE